MLHHLFSSVLGQRAIMEKPVSKEWRGDLFLRVLLGLGYVTHTEIEALIQGARMVVNPSLYEGGNCPGFDAWIRGVPVAMSNLAPF